MRSRVQISPGPPSPSSEDFPSWICFFYLPLRGRELHEVFYGKEESTRVSCGKDMIVDSDCR